MWNYQKQKLSNKTFFGEMKYQTKLKNNIIHNLNNNTKNKVNFFNPKNKFKSSSLEKNLNSINLTRLTKSPILNKKYTKNSPDNNKNNNTIDININVNYNHNKNINYIDKKNDFLLKIPNKKENNSIKKNLTSYSIQQSNHFRNKNKSMSNINESFLNNNLNISLTNFSSPKNSNSFIFNPVILQGKTNLDKYKIKKKKNEINNTSGITSNISSNLTSNQISLRKNSNSESNSTNQEELNKKLEAIKLELNKLKIMNNNNDKINVILNSINLFSNLLENKQKDILLFIYTNLIYIFNQISEENNLYFKEKNSLIKKINDLNKNIEILNDENKKLNQKLHNKEKYNQLNLNNLYNNFDKNEKIIISETESSVNTEELESIRFFDKINMRTHSFSNSKIPKLNLNFSQPNVNKTKNNYYQIMKINNKKKLQNNTHNNYKNFIEEKSGFFHSQINNGYLNLAKNKYINMKNKK